MGKTERFGLDTFGGPQGGSISDDGSKFSLGDRIALDHILQAFEEHNHKGGDRCPDPTEGPALALHATGGLLRPGKTYFYRCSFVDQYGLESAASPEVASTTPLSVLPPNQPVLTTGTGGTLPIGIYHYGLTLTDANGNSTRLGPLALVTVTIGNQTVLVTLPPVEVGQTLSVWRQNPNQSSYNLVATGLTSATLVDDGTTGVSAAGEDELEPDPSQQPPTSNLTSSTNSITITVGDAQLVATDGSPIKRWRVYRTAQSGTYAPSSLVAEIATTLNADGTGGLITSYTDTGASANPGQPLDTSQCLKPSVKIASGSGLGGGAFTMLSASTAPSGNPSARNWRLVSSPDGALTTVLAPGVPPLGTARRVDYFLMSEDSTIYKFTVDDDGDLHTDVGVPQAADTVFPYLQGPIINTAVPFVEYVLGVTNDGALTTTRLSFGPDDAQFDSFGQPIRDRGPLVPASPVQKIRTAVGGKGVYVLWGALKTPTWQAVIAADKPWAWFRFREHSAGFTTPLHDEIGHMDGLIASDNAFPQAGIPGLVDQYALRKFNRPATNQIYTNNLQPPSAGMAVEMICTLPDGSVPNSMGSNGRLLYAGHVDAVPTQAGFELYWDDATGELRFCMSDGQGANNPTVVARPGEYLPGKMNHIVASWDQAVMYLYLNGALVRTQPFVSHQFGATSTPSVLNYFNAGNLYIGGTDYSQDSFVGDIDEVVYWHQHLAVADVVRHYESI